MNGHGNNGYDTILQRPQPSPTRMADCTAYSRQCIIYTHIMFSCCIPFRIDTSWPCSLPQRAWQSNCILIWTCNSESRILLLELLKTSKRYQARVFNVQHSRICHTNWETHIAPMYLIYSIVTHVTSITSAYPASFSPRRFPEWRKFEFSLCAWTTTMYMSNVRVGLYIQ